MKSERANEKGTVRAPLKGRVVPLGEVPDPVFSDKILGDGCALLPEDGKIYSPVDGKVSSVAEAKHAYGFSAEDGTEVLVHVGLETVSLGGEGFTVHVKEGDPVSLPKPVWLNWVILGAILAYGLIRNFI